MQPPADDDDNRASPPLLVAPHAHHPQRTEHMHSGLLLRAASGDTPLDAAEAHLWAAIERDDARRVHELVSRWPALTRAQHTARHLASPMHVAASGGHLDVLRVLASAGASVNATDAMQATPLHYAAEHGRVEAVEWLLRREANVAVVDVLGCTPLHVGVRAGHVACVDTLLRALSVDSQNLAVRACVRFVSFECDLPLSGEASSVHGCRVLAHSFRWSLFGLVLTGRNAAAHRCATTQRTAGAFAARRWCVVDVVRHC